MPIEVEDDLERASSLLLTGTQINLKGCGHEPSFIITVRWTRMYSNIKGNYYSIGSKRFFWETKETSSSPVVLLMAA